MANVGAIDVALNLKGGGEFVKQIKASSSGVADFAKRMQGAGSVVRSAANQIGQYLSVAAAVGGGVITAGIIKQAQAIDQLAKNSDRLGVTTESLARLQYAGERFGVTADEMTDALKDMSEKIADAALNGGSYDETLTRMGLSAKQLMQIPLEDQFFAVSDAIGEMGTQNEKAFASMELMSDVGFRLVNGMDAGSEAFRRLGDEAEDLGLTLSRVDAAKVEDMNFSVARVKSTLGGVFNQLTVEVAPAVSSVANAFVEWAKTGNNVGSVLDNVMSFAMEGLEFVGNAVHGVWAGFAAGRVVVTEVFKAAIDGANAAVKAVQFYGQKFQVMGDIAGAVGEVIAFALENPITAAKSVFAGVLQSIGQGITAFFRNFQGLAEKLGILEEFQGMEDALRNSFQGAANSIGAGSEDVGARLGELSNSVAGHFSRLTDHVELEGSATLAAMSEGLTALAEEQREKLQSILSREAIGEQLRGFVEEQMVVANEAAARHADSVAAQQNRLTDIHGKGHQDRLALERIAAQRRQQTNSALNQALTQANATFGEKNVKISQGIAIAQATMNIAQGITAALATQNWAAAALTAAAGAIQIATIASAASSSGGSGRSPRVSGSGGAGGGAGPTAGGAAAPAAGAAPAAAPEQRIRHILEGGGDMTPEQLDHVARRMAEYARDGGTDIQVERR